MGNSPSLGRDRSRSISRTGGLLVLFEDGIAAPLSSSKRPSSPQRVVVRRARRRTGRHEEIGSIGIIAADLVPLTAKGLVRESPVCGQIGETGQFPAIHRDAKPKRRMTRHGQSPRPIVVESSSTARWTDARRPAGTVLPPGGTDQRSRTDV